MKLTECDGCGRTQQRLEFDASAFGEVPWGELVAGSHTKWDLCGECVTAIRVFVQGRREEINR